MKQVILGWLASSSVLWRWITMKIAVLAYIKRRYYRLTLWMAILGGPKLILILALVLILCYYYCGPFRHIFGFLCPLGDMFLYDIFILIFSLDYQNTMCIVWAMFKFLSSLEFWLDWISGFIDEFQKAIIKWCTES